jgi:putative sigma-54 modulation protein
MDPSPAVQAYASRKLEHVVNKYVSGMDVDSKVVFSTERFLHVANFTLNINGLTAKSTEKSEDMYSSIDVALDKLERQLRRFKTRIRDHRPDDRRRAFTMQVLAAPESETEEVEAVPEVPPEPEVPAAQDQRLHTVKTEQYTAPFLTPDEAILQLELRGSEFFVFTNRETESINIVYRRDDGNFGLIEAEAAHH